MIGKLHMEVAEADVLLRNLRIDNEHLKPMVQAQSSLHTASKDEEVNGKYQITSMLPYPVRVQIYEDIGGSDGDFLKTSGVPKAAKKAAKMAAKMAAKKEEVIDKNQIRPMLPTPFRIQSYDAIDPSGGDFLRMRVVPNSVKMKFPKRLSTLTEAESSRCCGSLRIFFKATAAKRCMRNFLNTPSLTRAGTMTTRRN